MRCSLVRSVWPSRALSTDTTSISAGVNGKSPNLRVWPIKVNTVFDLVDEQGSLGKDGRPPQFVVGVRRR
jgi:hypothetical protein